MKDQTVSVVAIPISSAVASSLPRSMAIGSSAPIVNKFHRNTQAKAVGFMSGTLWKKSRKHALIGRKWQRRWFELRHDALVYFQDATSASPKSSSPPSKISHLKVKAGTNVKLWWPDDSLWVHARVLQCKGRDSYDVIVLPNKLSNVIGISNKWVKDVERNRIRMVVNTGLAVQFPGNSDTRVNRSRSNSGTVTPHMAKTGSTYMGMIDTAPSNTSNDGTRLNPNHQAHLEEAYALAGDDCNFPPEASKTVNYAKISSEKAAGKGF